MAYQQKQHSIFRTVAIVLEPSYQATLNDDYIGIRTNGDVTVKLPEGKIGKTLIFKNEHKTVTGTIKIVPMEGHTIDQQSEYVMAEPLESITLIFSPEKNWCII